MGIRSGSGGLLGCFGGSGEHLNYFLKGSGVSLNESRWIWVVRVGSRDGRGGRRWVVLVLVVLVVVCGGACG